MGITHHVTTSVSKRKLDNDNSLNEGQKRECLLLDFNFELGYTINIMKFKGLVKQFGV